MRKKRLYNKIAHTAEHAFIGSLQKQINRILDVRKVEHREFDNSVFITIPHIDRELIVSAEKEVNSLITEGRKIISYSFRSLDDAKKNLPLLRANESRINADSPIRVIEIEGHDIAACAMEHATNLKECDLFLVTNVSKIGDEYVINFVVAQQAKRASIDLSLKLLKIYEEIGANYNTVVETVKKLQAINEINRSKLKKLTKEKLENISPQTVQYHDKKVQIINAAFTDLIDEEIRVFAGRKITHSVAIIILANINLSSDDTANIVFARSQSLPEIDCNKLLKEISSSVGGRGGGKPNFVTGVIKKEMVADFVKKILDLINYHQK
jgi:alanyl-tRNA synthetase